MNGLKRSVSILLVLAMILALTPAMSLNASASNYNASAAIDYARNHWNDGVGLCAEFVSNCLKAGGCSAYSARCTLLRQYLKDTGMGTEYRLQLESNGSVKMAGNEGKIAAGDPVIFWCANCNQSNAGLHAVLCNGADSSGYMKAYSHNNANNGQSRYYYNTSCYQCGQKTVVAYVYHMSGSSTPPSPSNRTGVYRITTVESPLTIRSGAGTGYSSIGSVPKGALVNITAISGSWGKVSYNGINGYVSLSYCSIITPFVDLGTDFYAYIIQAEKWKHLENSNRNVQIAAAGNDSFDPHQIWKFHKYSDGSYTIINCYDNTYLDNKDEGRTQNGNNIQTWPSYYESNQHWFLTEGGYIVTRDVNGMVLDVTNNNTSPGTNIQLYTLNQTGAQRFSVYKLTQDGLQYAKPAKPDAPVITSESPVTINTDYTLKWSASPLKNRFDKRSYTVKCWASGTLVLDKSGITDTSLLVQFAGVGTYQFQIIAVNDRYPNYSTASQIKSIEAKEAHSHKYTYKVTTTPTTSAAGKLTGTCSCGATTTVTLPKLDTTNYNYSVIKTPTCTTTGTGRYTWKVTTYGNFYFDASIAKTAHSYKTTVTAPTCTDMGYTTYTCSVCGDSYKDSYTTLLGHSYTYEVTTAPTTSWAGVLTGTCSRCNSKRIIPLPKLDTTNYDYTVTKAATCTATGIGRYTWKITTYGTFYFDVTIVQTPHNYKTTVIAPTCTEQGYTTHTCTRCGDSYVDSHVDALGHDFGEWVVTKEATEEKAGEETRICARCGALETRATAKLDCPAAKFVDVNPKAWYHKAIDFALTNSIFSGVDDTHFNPNGETTRAMFVAVLWRLDGRPESAAANPFVDVKAGSYYEKAVIWAAAHKIVAGADATHFSPNGNVTREQVAAFLYRYASAKGYDLSANADLSKFPDAGKISNYAKENLAWAVGAGLISGSKDAASGTVYLDPKGNATRAQVAQILMMFTQKIAK